MTTAQDQTPTPAAGCPVAHHGYEPFRQDDPFPAYRTLRAEEPVMYDERIGYWVVTRHEDVKAVFGDWETFSSENAQAPVRERGAVARRIMEEGGFTAYSGLSARVPPEHTRIRGIVQKAFTPRRYKSLEPFIRDNVARLLERMLDREDRTGDLVRDLAYDVPTITILTLFGEDIDQIEKFKRWSDSRGAMTWGDLSDEEQVPHAHHLVEYWQKCLSLVEKAHREGGDHLVADLVKAQEAGAEISDHEIASVCYSLLFAGHETTTTLISNTLRMLLAHPGRRVPRGPPRLRALPAGRPLPGLPDPPGRPPPAAERSGRHHLRREPVLPSTRRGARHLGVLNRAEHAIHRILRRRLRAAARAPRRQVRLARVHDGRRHAGAPGLRRDHRPLRRIPRVRRDQGRHPPAALRHRP